MEIEVKCFVLWGEGPMKESTGEDESGNDLASCMQWQLPAKELHGLWETLIYEGEIKQNLLNYATTAMLFSDRNVNPHIIAWNRYIPLCHTVLISHP